MASTCIILHIWGVTYSTCTLQRSSIRKVLLMGNGFRGRQHRLHPAQNIFLLDYITHDTTRALRHCLVSTTHDNGVGPILISDRSCSILRPGYGLVSYHSWHSGRFHGIRRWVTEFLAWRSKRSIISTAADFHVGVTQNGELLD